MCLSGARLNRKEHKGRAIRGQRVGIFNDNLGLTVVGPQVGGGGSMVMAATVVAAAQWWWWW